MRIALSLLLVAACSSEKPGMDGGADGSTDAPISDSASADAAPADASSDGCASAWSKCQNCIANNCSMDLVTCTMNPTCKTALADYGTCAGSCGTNCISKLNAQGALSSCVVTQCTKDCPTQ